MSDRNPTTGEKSDGTEKAKAGTGTHLGNDHYLYAVTVGCPNCEDVTQFVEVRDAPIPLDRDPSVEATHCPHCGIHLPSVGAEWDLRAEHEITTGPNQEADGGDQ